ncbi:hypothetical protein K466DRAFT_343576 [Polyporus arcularius HHB13444]|uniref:Uncharacterized protein n=1 Tax=Polyporus arcularius HHB13444 TaxID=1314778 RepID=A0A5C3NW79_9APHY|nr:hypothetical protein K466DRAFT_343576 [Polyporus arcularius HHB13444]
MVPMHMTVTAKRVGHKAASLLVTRLGAHAEGVFTAQWATQGHQGRMTESPYRTYVRRCIYAVWRSPGYGPRPSCSTLWYQCVFLFLLRSPYAWPALSESRTRNCCVNASSRETHHAPCTMHITALTCTQTLTRVYLVRSVVTDDRRFTPRRTAARPRSDVASVRLVVSRYLPLIRAVRHWSQSH